MYHCTLLNQGLPMSAKQRTKEFREKTLSQPGNCSALCLLGTWDIMQHSIIGKKLHLISSPYSLHYLKMLTDLR